VSSSDTRRYRPDCGCWPHGPDEPCTCDGCTSCTGRVVGCTCDIAWDCEHDYVLPLHRTQANVGMACSTCDGGGCPDCTDPS
jgi:hypothetical protein